MIEKNNLLYEIKKILPKINIYGLDVSKYAQKIFIQK